MAGSILLLGILHSGCTPRHEPLQVGAGVSAARVAELAREPQTEFDVGDALSGGGAVALSGDTTAFLDFSLARVLVVDAEGRVVRTFGGRGGGPGEVQNPRFLVRTRTGVGVFDDRKLALVMFTPEGRSAGEVPITSVVGSPAGIVTGLSPLDNGGWVFSVRERTDTSVREALYVRSGEEARLLTATPEAPLREVRLPCGITMSPGPPVFWPTLRWSVSGMRVAAAATADDRVVWWDLTMNDSSVIVGDRDPPPAGTEAAEGLPLGLQVSMGSAGCTLSRAEALRQRGMAKVIPAIDRIALAPDGALWLTLTSPTPGPQVTRVTRGAVIDTLTIATFPVFFIDSTHFLGAETDTTTGTIAAVWSISYGRARALSGRQ